MPLFPFGGIKNTFTSHLTVHKILEVVILEKHVKLWKQHTQLAKHLLENNNKLNVNVFKVI